MHKLKYKAALNSKTNLRNPFWIWKAQVLSLEHLPLCHEHVLFLQ